MDCRDCKHLDVFPNRYDYCPWVNLLFNSEQQYVDMMSDCEHFERVENNE